MKTKSEQKNERGNALIYVLIAIVLFAALSFTMSRQMGGSDSGSLDQEKARLYATELINYAANAKEAYDKMQFSGAKIEDINFLRPGDAGFETAPTIRKIYHPDGGGLNLGTLPEQATADGVTDPLPGWYMGRFNDVEWTDQDSTTDPANYREIILTAYGITEPVCTAINEKITGNATIPAMTDSVKEALVPRLIEGITIYTIGVNVDLTTDPDNTPPPRVCEECHGRASLCVQEGGIYGFYTVIADR